MQWRHDSWLSLIFIQVNKLGFPYTHTKKSHFLFCQITRTKKKEKKDPGATSI